MSTKTLIRATTALALCALASASLAQDTTITIATVNNGDMIRMQGYTDQFTEATGIGVEWVTLEENVLRQRVTTDITTNGGQFDIMTIGMYETPIWGANGWLVPLDDLSEDYNVDDILPAMRAGLSDDGTLYAAPFYGESSMVMYRTDLMEEAGLEMPHAPTWGFIREAAAAMTDRENDQYGVCLRGKPGWGEGGAFITVTGNSFGARWFDEGWNAQFDQPEWEEALNFHVDLMNNHGPPGYENNGFNENLSLFQQGRCGMWIDATMAASFVTNPEESTIADSVGFALAPNHEGVDRRANWLWAWALAIPAGTPARRCRDAVHRMGHLGRLHRAGRRERRLGQRAAGRAHLALRDAGIPGRAVRTDHARLDQRGRPDQPDGGPGALCRHPVRGDPRVCRHRHRGEPGILGRLCRAAKHR